METNRKETIKETKKTNKEIRNTETKHYIHTYKNKY